MINYRVWEGSPHPSRFIIDLDKDWIRLLHRYHPRWYLVYDRAWRTWHIAFVSDTHLTPFMRLSRDEKPGYMYVQAQLQKAWYDSSVMKDRGIGRLIDEAEYEARRRREREEEDFVDWVVKSELKERLYVI